MGASTKIVINSTYTRQDGTAALYLRIIIDRESARFPLNLFCNPKYFNAKTGTVKLPAAKESADLNLELDAARSRATEILVYFRLSERPITIDDFRTEWTNPEKRHNFVDWMAGEIESLRGMVAPNTIKSFKATLKHLKKFQPRLRFQDLTAAWPEAFEKYLKVRMKLQAGTREKQHKNVKRFVNLALRKGVRMQQPYKHFRIQGARSNPVFLTREEVAALTKLYYSNTLTHDMQEHLRMFLFCTFTGPRYSDVNAFTSQNISDGHLIYTAKKTMHLGKTVKVPLLPAARRFLKEIASSNRTLFTPKSNQKYNAALKYIGSRAGISKPITSHVARHSFATLFLEAGGRVETLRELLGHTSIATTMVYVHLTDKRKEQEMQLLETMAYLK